MRPAAAHTHGIAKRLASSSSSRLRSKALLKRLVNTRSFASSIAPQNSQKPNKPKPETVAQNYSLDKAAGQRSHGQSSAGGQPRNKEPALGAPIIEYMTSHGYDIQKSSHASELDIEATIHKSSTALSRDAHPFVGDQFCARVFATKAFHPSFVMRTLSTFGVRSIGPLSLQALAIRCQGMVDEEYQVTSDQRLIVFAREVAYHLVLAEQYGLIIQQNDYALLIQKLANNSNGKLLELVLSSDQHPDVYSDHDLQQDFLRTYVRDDQILLIDKTLHILTIHSKHPIVAAWNFLFRAHIRLPYSQRWSKLPQLLDHMIAHDIRFTGRTMKESLALLRPRATGKNYIKLPPGYEFDDVLFVANMWIRILTAQPATPHQPEAWIEILKRFGKIGRLAALESLIKWLAHAYSDHLAGPPSPSSRYPALNIIFNNKTQQAIIDWYFLSLSIRPRQPDLYTAHPLPSSSAPGINLSDTETTSHPALDSVEKWAQGVALIKLLKHRGVAVDTPHIREAVLFRLTLLFHEHTYPSRVRDRFARTRNTHSLPSMVRHLQRLWGGADPLFPIPDSLFQDESARGDADIARLINAMFTDLPRSYRPSLNTRDPNLLRLAQRVD